MVVLPSIEKCCPRPTLKDWVLSAVKYPIFAMILGWLLGLLKLAITGIALVLPHFTGTTLIWLGVVIFIYEWLKYGVGFDLP